MLISQKQLKCWELGSPAENMIIALFKPFLVQAFFLFKWEFHLDKGLRNSLSICNHSYNTHRLMVHKKTCTGVAERLFAETDLEINFLYNGALGYDQLGFVCPSFCCRLCRKTQPLQKMKGVWLLSLHLKMSPQVHSNLCKGLPQAFGCANHPWLSTRCIDLTKFSMDTNILPDVFLLVLTISEHLHVRAKVGWFCHLRRSSGIWVPEPCSTIWSPDCYCFYGSYNFRLALGIWICLCLSSSNPWLLLLLPSMTCEALVQWMHPSTKKIILFCLFVFVNSQGISDPDITLIRPFFFL